MHLRRLISVLGVAAVVGTGVVAAQPKKADKKADKKKDDKKKDDKKKGSAAEGSAAGSAAAGSAAGSAVAPIEDAPPKDIEGREENPDAPKTGGETEEPPTTVAPAAPTGYPLEEVARPITLHKGMFEFGLAMPITIPDFHMSSALKARFGITNKIQIGLTYTFLGIWDARDVDNAQPSKIGVHPGKAVGLDFTYALTDWGAVRLGFPLYIDPFAMSLTIGAPMKFRIGDKVAIGLLDELLNIRLVTFPVAYYDERKNAIAAQAEINNTAQSRGDLNFSGYGEYQLQPQLALIGRLGLRLDDFSQNRNAAGHGGWFTSLRAGGQYSIKPFIDLGGTLGFDDLSTTDSFGIDIYLNVRI